MKEFHKEFQYELPGKFHKKISRISQKAYLKESEDDFLKGFMYAIPKKSVEDVLSKSRKTFPGEIFGEVSRESSNKKKSEDILK